MKLGSYLRKENIGFWYTAGALENSNNFEMILLYLKLQFISFHLDDSWVLIDEMIFPEWDVMYCSNPTSPGGGYRSAVGRLFFKAKEMVQVVEAPDTVKNSVSFTALGFLDGEVSLKGRVQPANHVFLNVGTYYSLPFCKFH